MNAIRWSVLSVVLACLGCHTTYEHHLLKMESNDIEVGNLRVTPSFYFLNSVRNSGTNRFPPWQFHLVMDGPVNIDKVIIKRIYLQSGDNTLDVLSSPKALAETPSGSNDFYVNHTFPTEIPKTFVQGGKLSAHISGEVHYEQQATTEFEGDVDFQYVVDRGEETYNPLLDPT